MVEWSLNVAEQTLEYAIATGRFGSAAEIFIKNMGRDEFLALAATKWEAAGSRKFMNGMKDVMKSIIFEDTNE